MLYKNPNNVNAKIKYTVNTPPYVNPLCVAKGGTGNIELYPYAILRGNGQDPIISNSDLVFLNNELIVNGNASFSGDLDFGQVSTFNSNNGVSNESITNFVYNNTIRYFVSIVSVKITTSTDIIISAGQIKGVQLNSSWNIIQDIIGDLTGYTFSMSTIGQLKYTSSSIGNYISSIIKFKTLSILKI